MDSGAGGGGDPGARGFFRGEVERLIAHVRHQARLDRPPADAKDDRTPWRKHLEVGAARGNRDAIAALRVPECPEDLLYLRDWAYALYGRSGIGMDGAAPLSYTTVADWARLNGIVVQPHEVEALMAVDAVIRHPELSGDDEPAAPAPLTPWPTKGTK